jgi:hypothetical protein
VRAATRKTVVRLPDAFWLAVAGLAAATVPVSMSVAHGWLSPDAARFAQAGATILSGDWAHAYADAWVQAAPLQLLTAMLFARIGWNAPSLALITMLTTLTVVVAATRVLVGKKTIAVLLVGGGALALGPLVDVYKNGHFAEPLCAVLWVIAAREARAGRVYRAGALIGVSAGFELWGVLGLGVLALAPDNRRAIPASAVAIAIPAILLAPFMLAGDFHMFDYHWRVTGGALYLVLGTGHPFGWALRLFQGAVTCAVAAGLARVVRRSPAAIYVVPAAASACRLALDPMGLYYYWDTLIVIALLALAGTISERAALRAWLDRTTREPRPAATRHDDRHRDHRHVLAGVQDAHARQVTTGAATSGTGSGCLMRSRAPVHFGIHQFQSPSSFISAGTSSARITVASKMIPAARPIASDLTS